MSGTDLKLPDSHRLRYQREALSLEKELRGALHADGSVDDQTVWEVYAETEKLIALMKFRLGYETPGVFTELPLASDPSRLLDESPALLAKGADQILEQHPTEAIGTLRAARNNLRSYLTGKSRSASRGERRENKSGR